MAKINFSLICFSIVLILLFNGNVHGTVLGDIDGSDKVEVNDIILGLQILTGSTPGLKIHPEADVNRNKKLGLEEVIFDLQVVANLREEPSFYKLPELIRYEFSVQETKSLPGNSTEAGTGWNCAGIIEEEDKIGSIALVSLFYQNGCYTDGRYNHNNYQVERGVVHDIEDKFQFQSYKIYEPLSKATEFLASEHAVYYKFPSKEDYIVYTFENDTFSKVIEVPASEIITNEFIKLEELTVSRIEGSRIYVFVPSTQRVSTFTELASGIEGAHVRSTGLGDLMKYRYTVNDIPFDTIQDFDYGPGTHFNAYSFARQFFMVQQNQQLGILWQDKVDKSIQLTWIAGNFKSQASIELPNYLGEDLVCACYDDLGGIYYLTVQSGSGAYTEIARTATMYKVDGTGQEIRRLNLDTSLSGLNMVEFGPVASIDYSNGELGLILSRTMHESSDGLNHQGAIAVVFDAVTLDIVHNWGQTSGHSFENILKVNSSGKFVAIDLGDNYPRGINLHKFNSANTESRVVFTFKTRHGTTPESPAGITYPKYTEISNTETIYYQWSNDNYTYTELGGILEGNGEYTIFFANESTSNGLSLDNSRVGGALNDPRNIGMITVISDFENASGMGTVVSDDLVLSSGITETGGYYTFGGYWRDQRNKGVVWLTDYSDENSENVSRLKAIKLDNVAYLLVWEKWSAYDYIATYAMKIDQSGNILTGPVELGAHVRLNRQDEIWNIDDKVYMISGNKTEKKLELIEFQLKD